MPDLRGAMAYLLRLRLPFRAEDLAQLAVVPLPRARAYLSLLRAWRPGDHALLNDARITPGVVVIDADGTIVPGEQARRWLALDPPKTRPGGNSTLQRQQRELRADLERRAFAAVRAGKALPPLKFRRARLLTSEDAVLGQVHGQEAENVPTDAMPQPEGLTLAQAAAALQVHPDTVRAWIHDGRMRAVRVGPKLIRIPHAEIARVRAPVEARRG